MGSDDVVYTMSKEDREESDSDNVDSYEHYENSVLAPLRRRLSDVGSTAASTTSRPVALVFPNDHHVTDSAGNEQNVPPITDCSENGIVSNDLSSIVVHPPPTSETKSTPDPLKHSSRPKKLKSCLSSQSNKKRQRSPFTTPATSEIHLNPNIHNDPSSPIVEPSRKKQRCSNALMDSIVKVKSGLPLDDTQVPLTCKKIVHFAPSSAVEYEVEVPVCQSLTPIPAETATCRYPTEMKAQSIEEAELIQITKQNHAILKAFDDMYDSDMDIDRIKRRRKHKRHQAMKNRRRSFYIPSTHFQNGDVMSDQIHDPHHLNTI